MEDYNNRKWTKSKLIQEIAVKDQKIKDRLCIDDDKNKKIGILENENHKLKKKLDAALEPKFLCLAKTEINVSSKVLDGSGSTHTNSIGVGTKWIFNKSEAERLKGFGSVEILEELSDEKFLTRLKEIEAEFKKESKENYELYTNLLEKSKRMELEANSIEEENKRLNEHCSNLRIDFDKLFEKYDYLESENKELTKDILRLVRKYVK